MDFSKIKAQVRILDVMRRYNVHLKGGENGWYNADCPLPTHEKSRGTFAVNHKDNFWMCHSDSCQTKRGGKKGGDVIAFVRLMESCTDKEAAQKLCEWYNLNPEQKKAAQIEQPKEEVNTPSKNQSYPTSPTVSVKGYMKDVDVWFNELITRGDQEDEESYLKRVRNAVKTRLMESYRNGQRAAQGLPAA